jgi:hypothetical protein
MSANTLTDRQILEALYEKAYKPSGHFGMDSVPSPQILPVPKPRLTPQINAFPAPGKEYKKVGAVPQGYHIEYDDANDEEVLYKTCGPLGSR